MSAPTIPNLNSPHAIVLIGTDGVPYAATGGGGGGGAAISAGASSQNSGTVVFSNSNNVTFGMNNGVVTASASGAGGGGGVAIAGSNSTFTSGTVVMSAAGGALTISNGAQSVIFSVPATSSLVGAGNISISTAGSTITISGSTQSVQTQASGNIAGVGTTFNGAGVSGSMTLNSGGLNLSLSGGGGAGGGIALANSQTTYTSGTAWIIEGGGAITIGSTANGASQSFTIGVPATSSLVGANGVSVSSNGSTISIIGGSGIPYLSYFEPQQRAGAIVMSSQGSITNTTVMYMQPFIAEQFVTAYRGMVMDSLSTAVSTLSYQQYISTSAGSSSTGAASGVHSYTAALFSRQSTGTNAASANLISFTSNSWTRSWSYGGSTTHNTNVSTGSMTLTTAMSMGFISNIDSAGHYTTGSISFSSSSSASQTSTSSGTSSGTCSFTLNQVYMTGIRPLNIPLAFSLTPGEYWLGLQYKSTSGTSGTAVASACMYTLEFGVMTSTGTIMYPLGISAQTGSTTNAQQGLGSISTGVTATTFGISAITNNSGVQTWFNFQAATL